MEKNMLQKVDAFGYLYKEHHKEINILIEKRDKEIESTLNYKEKLLIERAWIWSTTILSRCTLPRANLRES